MDKSSPTSTSIKTLDYNLIREIQDEIDSSWSSGQKIFDYKIPKRNRQVLAMILANLSSKKVMTELISEKHTVILSRLVKEFDNDGTNIRASFWEQSRFNIEKGRSDGRMIIIEGATEQMLTDSIVYTAGIATAPCVILLR